MLDWVYGERCAWGFGGRGGVEGNIYCESEVHAFKQALK